MIAVGVFMMLSVPVIIPLRMVNIGRTIFKGFSDDLSSSRLNDPQESQNHAISSGENTFNTIFDSAQSAFLLLGICGIGGIAMIVAGVFVRRAGKMGLAGSGVILDPAKARQEVEPFSRMTGGAIKDALEEADIKIGSGGNSERVVVIKCTTCGTLNDQDAKFCKSCGQKI